MDDGLSSNPLRLAVVGVGHLGRHHARILAALPGVELTAVVDVNRARAEEIAAAHRTQALTDYRDVIGKVDAVTIAAPTELHASIGCACLNAGVAALVEKPLARSLAEADALLAAAAEGRVFGVGHTERFNPAVAAAAPHLSDPRFIEVHRLGTFPERSLDIDVVFDLMIHDLDVVLSLVDSDVESLEAVGVPVITNRVDIANARLRFASGLIANLTASRVSVEKVRKFRVFSPRTYISVDFARREANVYRLGEGSGGPEIQAERKAAPDEEPLRRQLAAFVECAASRSEPVVSGADGLRALRLAHTVLARMAEQH